MKIRYQTWRRVTRVGTILVIPVILFLFLRPDWGVWGDRLTIPAYIILFSLPVAGALLAILTRAGVVRMVYSDTEKQSLNYRLSKIGAELEQRQGRGFSKSYYENLDVKPSEEKNSDGKPAA